MSQANRRSLWTFTVLLALTLAAAAALSIWGRLNEIGRASCRERV